MILVRKKDGSYRFCIDYSRLNSITIKDEHPLPLVDDSLDALSGATLFSTLDLSSGYWQIQMDDASREKTAFTTGDSLYHFKVIPMGLTNAPPTFQRLMELVLRGLHWSKTLVYLDDIIVFSKTFKDHIQDLSEVFGKLRQAGLKLHPQKCQFFKQSVLFLGHVVLKDGIQPDTKVTEKVLNWPRPTMPREVRACIGLCSYYQRFIKDFAEKAAPLHSLTKKHAKFTWSEQCEDTFQYFWHALASPPILTYPDFSKSFILYTDASHPAIGSILAQQQGVEKVVAYTMC